MSSKYTTVRLTIEGEHFEILVNPEAALNFKLGKKVEPSQVIAVDQVFLDANKGLRVSSEKLKKYFNTDDQSKAALEILKRGELQLTQEQRRRLIEEKRKAVISIISKNYVDPKTLLPHPPLRIEQAMVEAKVSIDPFADPNEQTKAIVEKLRSILPLKSEKLKLSVRVSAQYAGQTIGVLKSFGDIVSQQYSQDGSLNAIVEIPAGSQPSLLERLASVTKGAAQATVVR
jgi:ribosome maturation protein SDO1